MRHFIDFFQFLFLTCECAGTKILLIVDDPRTAFCEQSAVSLMQILVGSYLNPRSVNTVVEHSKIMGIVI